MVFGWRLDLASKCVCASSYRDVEFDFGLRLRVAVRRIDFETRFGFGLQHCGTARRIDLQGFGR